MGADVRDELLDPEPVEPSEASDEAGLRPRTLSDFVGQAELKEHLSIILGAAKLRSQAADHLLFAGPPGLGKTTLADRRHRDGGRIPRHLRTGFGTGR